MPATYFHFRNLEDIQREIARLGLGIRFESDVSALGEPVRIGPFTARNSLGIHPMEGCDGTLDGEPGELTLRRYERFASGGASIIWFEATAIAPEARANPRQLLLNRRTASSIESALKLIRKSHATEFGASDGLICGIQLTHSGRYSHGKPMIVMHDPSHDRKKNLPPDYPVLADDDLERLQDAYVEAARIAVEIGFQFIDIKQCHRYLLNEILAAKTRAGEYGGSFENRTRLARNIIMRIKDLAGDQVVLATRLNCYDGVPYDSGPDNIGVPMPFERPYQYGFGCDENDPLKEDLTEPKRWVTELYALGVRIVNVTMGNPYSNPHIGRPFERAPIDGYASPEHPLIGVDRHFRITREIQQTVPEMVVLGTGYSYLREYLCFAAEANKRNGWVTVAAVGRGALAYPDYVKDVLYDGGQMNRKKVCLGVSYCTALMRAKDNELGQYPTGCVPRDDVYVPIYKETEQRRKEGTEGKEEKK